MKTIEALDTVTFGEGAILGLNKDQAEGRRRVLKALDDGTFQTIGSVQFKRGERFGYDGVIPKTMREIVTVDGESVAPERAAVKPSGPVKFVLPKTGGAAKPSAKKG